MEYDATIIEVMDQYELTQAQREMVLRQVNSSLCPWSRRIAYMRAHTFAAAAERGAV